MKKSLSAGGIVLNDKNEIALVKDEDNIWMIPKGHIDDGETLFDCAKREIFEETGIKDLQKVDELDKYERYSMNNDGTDDLSKLKTIKLFVFKTSQIDLSPQADDVIEAKWFDKTEAVEALTHKKDKEILANYVKLHI